MEGLINRIRDLVGQVQNLGEHEAYQLLGALQWLVNQGLVEAEALYRYVPVDKLRAMYPGLPAPDELERMGRNTLRGVVETLWQAVCSERRLSRVLRRVVANVGGVLGGPIVDAALTKVALATALTSGIAALPMIGVVCGHLIVEELAERGLKVGCEGFGKLVEALGPDEG